MGVYARHVLPRLIDLAMRSRVVGAERAKLVPGASGKVLEVGVGSGLNLRFYAPRVEGLWGLDPSLELWRLARRRVARAPFPVRFIAGSAERIPVVGGTFDAVVTTCTLCSIPDPGAALAEMKRVLAPGGRLVFIEHGRSPDARVLAWQDRLTPVWKRLAGGCHLNRRIDALIVAAGFTITDIETGYIDGPRPFTYLFRGVAAPAPR
jgi:ubiquinone/menaquinone biosynthesis C-methylase UbiE